MLEGAFFFTAFAFLDTNVLVPVFLEGLTGNRDLVGVAATVRQIGFLAPTLFMAGLVHRIPDIRFFLLSIYLARCIPIVLVAVSLLIPNLPPLVIASLFLVGLGLFMGADGASQLPWLEVLHGAVPGNQRGKVIGWLQASGGLGALLMGVLITRMLEQGTLPFRSTFGLFFALATVALLLSALCFAQVRVAGLQVHSRQGARFAWWFRIPSIVRGDRRFRRVLILQALMGSGGMALPFYALYLRDAGAISPDWIGVLHVTQVLGGVAGGFLLGWLNDRSGPGATLRLSSGVGLAIPAVAMTAGALGSTGAPLALSTFVLVGISMGVWLPQINYLMGIAPAAERPYYFATGNLNGLIVSLLPMLGGFLVRFVPYSALFGLVLVIQMLGLWAASHLAEVPSQTGEAA